MMTTPITSPLSDISSQDNQTVTSVSGLDAKPLPENKRKLGYPLVLASGSPRRHELFASLNLDYEVIVSSVDEGAFNLDHLSPSEFVSFLARTKAQDVFKQRPDAYVVGADTIVVLDGQVFGKPVDEEDACRMLTLLQGRAHQVYSGICIFNPDRSQDESAIPQPFLTESRSTTVYMREMNPAEVRAYVATGEPMDKAGAYAIQGYGAALIERIDGCYFNVVGLSLNLLDRMFTRFGEKIIL